MGAKFNSMTLSEKSFPFFQPFRLCLPSKFVKSAKKLMLISNPLKKLQKISREKSYQWKSYLFVYLFILCCAKFVGQ